MAKIDFLATLSSIVETAPSLRLDGSSRILIISDLHLGDGSAGDDFMRNEGLLLDALDGLYLKDGWTVILNGDVEELQKFKMKGIRAAHEGLYSRLDALRGNKRLFKIIGNHDLALLAQPERPYELHHALVLDYDGNRLACFHGHQASKFFSKHSYLSDFIVRYVAHPLKIKNRDKPIKSQLKNERRIYKASKAMGIASIAGHTHHPLFESFDKVDWLRFSLESLLREHPGSSGKARAEIENEISSFSGELKRLSRRRIRRGFPMRSFYESDGLPVPCLFNSGCVTARHGFTGIEIEGGDISLVSWSKSGKAKDWIEREAVMRLVLDGRDATRYTLRREPLDIVFSKIRLLGPSRGKDTPMPERAPREGVPFLGA
jgi:UDP-2,3-diacylglucosamine pyrophosphatase LpxH